MVPVLRAEPFAELDTAPPQKGLAEALRHFPDRWSAPTVAAARVFTSEMTSLRWQTVLDELEEALRSVAPEEATGNGRPSGIRRARPLSR